jgi:hypothetical protein
MAFTVNDFRAKLQYGGTRQNLFEVLLPFPAVSGGASQQEYFAFMCKAASLPGEELGTIVVPYFGRQIKVPGDRTFPEWSVTVINDEDFVIRNTFEMWSNAINGHYSNLRLPAALLTNGYKINASVIQYGKIGDVIMEYDMNGMWPAAVAPIDVSWESVGQIEDFQVSFQYDWWESRSTL